MSFLYLEQLRCTRLKLAWITRMLHAIFECNNYSRSLISFRYPARCALSRDKFSHSRFRSSLKLNETFFYSCLIRCPRYSCAWRTPPVCVAMLYFLAAAPWRTPRICMVQYRTFLGSQLRESILGPIGSRVGALPNETPHGHPTWLCAVGLPPFMIHCERAR